MGAVVPRCCLDCFSSAEVIEEQELSELKRVILDTGRSSDTEDVADSATQPYSEGILIETHLAGPLETLRTFAKPPFITEPFFEVSNKQGLHIAAKNDSLHYVLKFQWTMNYPAGALVELLLNEDRRKWDTSVDEFSIISRPTPYIALAYLKFKGYLMISPRDMVLATMVVHLDGGVYIVSASIDHPDYPERENIVRAHMEVAGYFIEESGSQENKVSNLTVGSFKGNITNELARKTLCLAYPKHLKAMKAALKASFSKT